MNIITSSNSVEFLKTMIDQQLGIGFQTIVGLEVQVERGELLHVPLVTTGDVNQEFALCRRSGDVTTAALDRLIVLLRQRLADYAVPTAEG